MHKSKIQCEKCSFEKIFPSEKVQHEKSIECPECNNTFMYGKNIYFDNSTSHKSISANDLTLPKKRI